MRLKPRWSRVTTTSDTAAPSTCTLREAIAWADGNADSGNCTHTGKKKCKKTRK